MDEKYMLRAIELALKGRGAVNPNPLVGAVIVKDGRIIGEGYHRKYGSLHAERDAFSRLTENANGADMYVTLEPCCHYGKQPPCTESIVEHGIKNIYVGSDDNNPLVSGKGYAYLKDHGVNVYTHVLKKECDDINKVFFHYIKNKTPYVFMKYAMTMDGKIACYTGESKWITGDEARKDVHLLRSEYTAIMVGINTVLKDDPLLTSRIDDNSTYDIVKRNPVRIVCDSSLKIPLDCGIVNTADKIKTIVACAVKDEELIASKKKELINKGINIINCYSPEKESVDLHLLLKRLGEMSIDSILLEGGATLNASFLKENLVNHIRVYMAPKIFGGKTALSPVSGTGVSTPDEAYMFKCQSVNLIGDDVVLDYEKIS